MYWHTYSIGPWDTAHTHWQIQAESLVSADGWIWGSQGPVGLLSSCQAYTQTYISTHSQNHTWSWTKNGRQIELLNSQNSIERMADFHKTHSSSTHALHLLCLFIKQVCYSKSVLHLYWKHFSGFTFFVDFWFLILKHFIARNWVWHPYQTFNVWCQQLKIQESFPLPF